MAQTRILAFIRVASLAATFTPSAYALQPRQDLDTALPIVEQACTYLHENSELGMKGFKADEYVEAHLRSLGYKDFIAARPSRSVAAAK